MPINRHFRSAILALALFSAVTCADEVEYAVSGVDEPMLSNVLNHVSVFRVGSSARLNSRLRRKIVADAEKAATDAMRPFGYFNPVVSVEMSPGEARKWLLTVDVQAGPPVTITELQLELTGPGSGLDSLIEWYLAFPLEEGGVLNQQAWDRAKSDAFELLEESGYLLAEFTRHTISVDPVANTARLELVLDTGQQAVMGAVTFNQDLLNDGILDSLQRFQQGDAYKSW